MTDMPLSGEAIRLMNYIDDVAVTLRRVLAFIPTLTAEERARVHEHLKQSRPNAEDIVKALSD
jgi:phosphoserine phosphatase